MEGGRRAVKYKTVHLDELVEGAMRDGRLEPIDSHFTSLTSALLDERDDQFATKLAGLIGTQIQKYDGKRGQLVLLKALLKQSTANLSTDEAKELNTLMGTIFNDKSKALDLSARLCVPRVQ